MTLVDYTWTAPDGTILPLTVRGNADGVRTLAGGDGLGATPRALTTQALATGGALARWSHAEPRTIALPLRLQAATHNDVLTLRRQVARAFTQTTPAAGVPTPGVLRVTRADATWREISALYVDGLGWDDDWAAGPLLDRAVLQLLAPDPWWYGPETIAASYGSTATPRNYFQPYETVAASQSLGTVTVTIDSDVPVDPVWTLTGPAATVTITVTPDGPGLTYGAIAAGTTITVDVAAGTVTDQAGANQVGGIDWPTSTLFQLQPGDTTMSITIAGGTPETSAVGLTYRPRWETA